MPWVITQLISMVMAAGYAYGNFFVFGRGRMNTAPAQYGHKILPLRVTDGALPGSDVII